MSGFIRNRIFLLFAVVALFFITGRAYQNQAFSFHFVDEEDNIVLGTYLLKGEKLYSNLFSHHQPFAYILSAGVQKITDPNSIYLLIKRHREAIIAWSLIWGIILVLRFKGFGLLTLLIYEPLKIFLLGHLFLSESLAVYPFAFLLSWIFLTDKKILKCDYFLIGLCFSLSFLLLSPLWPLLLVLAILVFKQIRQVVLGRLMGLGILGGVLIPVVLVLSFISIPDYIFNAFYINFKYYIPMTADEPVVLAIIKSFASPLLTLLNFQNGNATLQVMRLLSIILIFSAVILIKKGYWKLPIGIILLLGFTNIRFVYPGQENYSGFHIIPWFMALIILSIQLASRVLKVIKGKRKYIFLLPLVFFLGMIIIRESSQTLFAKKDMSLDFYVNYSQQENFGTAVKIMKTLDDKLFVVPDDWLVYWQADIDHFTKMVNYYAWMSEVPEIKNPLEQKFSESPPTYFYCNRCEKGYFGLEKYFYLYHPLKQDNKETKLLVLKTKLKNLTPQQIKELDFYRFKVD